MLPLILCDFIGFDKSPPCCFKICYFGPHWLPLYGQKHSSEYLFLQKKESHMSLEEHEIEFSFWVNYPLKQIRLTLTSWFHLQCMYKRFSCAHHVWFNRVQIYIYIYAFSRRFYPKRLTLHSSYSFIFYQLLLSLGIEPMILALLAPCSTIWATGRQIFLEATRIASFCANYLLTVCICSLVHSKQMQFDICITNVILI